MLAEHSDIANREDGSPALQISRSLRTKSVSMLVKPMSTLTLRPWKESDIELFAQMNADPDVMRYFAAPLTWDEARAALARMRTALDERGWGIWAVEVDSDFAGMTGLNVPRWQLPCSPCTEVLWRFRKQYWGQGLAHRAAKQAINYGFSTLGLTELVAFTTRPNNRSIRLMERLGFVRDPEGDFEHPAIPEGHDLRGHILYRLLNANLTQDPSDRPSPTAEQAP